MNSNLPRLSLPLCFLIFQCSFLTPAPVGDETHISYSIRDEFNTTSLCTLRFGKGPRGLLELTVDRRDTVKGTASPGEKSSGLFDTAEPVVAPDADGKIMTSRFLKRRGGQRLELTEFGPLWLPPWQLTRGHRFALSARFGSARVDMVFKSVCVVTIGGKESTISGTGFYSTSTGILISSRVVNNSTRYYSPDSVATLILSGSNIPGI